MIEPTEEMRLVAYRAGRQWATERGHPLPDDRMLDAVTAAVLAVVERDYPLVKPCPSGPNGRCLAVMHSASNAGLCRSHGCVYPGPEATPPQ